MCFCCTAIYFLSVSRGNEVFVWSKSLMANVSKHGERRRFPRALIIGVRKCGTRALIEFINIHPMVRVCHLELNFFNMNERYLRGYDWYLDQMPRSFVDQITIEKTPNYFPTKATARRVLEMNPKMKLILIVRDPVTRIVSDYLQGQHESRKRNESALPPFEQLAMNNATGQLNEKWRAVRIGRYAVYLAVWLQFFPRDQILVLSDERLTAKPKSELAKLESFLGLEPLIRENHFAFNKTRGFMCYKSYDKSQRRCLGESKGAKHPEVDAALLQKLTSFYKPFNELFFSLVGEDFGWNNKSI